jgi:ABC-type lipoprotein release transport system permease subunit
LRLLYDVRPTDASSFAAAALLLGLAALAASDLPARRAARLDPVAAMRQE